MDINELLRRLHKIYVWVGQENPIRHEVLDLINIIKAQIPPDQCLPVEGEIIVDEVETPIANTTSDVI